MRVYCQYCGTKIKEKSPNCAFCGAPNTKVEKVGKRPEPIEHADYIVYTPEKVLPDWQWHELIFVGCFAACLAFFAYVVFPNILFGVVIWIILFFVIKKMIEKDYSPYDW